MAKVVKKGKKQRKNRISSKRWEKYKLEGESIKRTHKSCPRCGLGIFLANSKGRRLCGACRDSFFERKVTEKSESFICGKCNIRFCKVISW